MTTARVFQLVCAVAEWDWRLGSVRIIHGDNLTSEVFYSCNWFREIERADMDMVREAIAAHLNECSAFRWPTLPTILPKPTNVPPLTARDVLPGETDSNNFVMRFGVIADAFEVAE